MIETSEKSAVDGILLLYKPQGLTSNQALQRVKRIFGAQKAGHTGSLDPLATGMLPVCFGEATKFSQYLLDADKCYQTTGHLGVQTDTGDATGQIIQNMPDITVTLGDLTQVLSEFQGDVLQTPSMYSALKYQGRALYHYARQGIDVPRKSRHITIHKLTLDAFDGQQMKLTVVCSKGTYIRNLVEDIGHGLGVGAHVVQLHRVYTAGFQHHPMWTLEQLADMSTEERSRTLLPMTCAVKQFTPLHMTAESKSELAQGKVIFSAAACDMQGTVQLLDDTGQFFGLGDVMSEGMVKVKRLLKQI